MTQQEVLTLLSKVKHDAYALGFEKIGLFGSFATSKAHAMSDVDVAVYSNKNKTGLGFVYLEKIEHFKSILKKLFKRPVDVYDLNTSHRSTIKTHIEKEVIYV